MIITTSKDFDVLSIKPSTHERVFTELASEFAESTLTAWKGATTHEPTVESCKAQKACQSS